MSVKANWFVDDLVADEPTAAVISQPVDERIEEVGVPFSLSDPDQLLDEVAKLIEQESALFNQGLTCEVKDRADTACSACPFSHHNEEGHPLQQLCHVGQEQERILTLHAHLKLR